MRTIHYCVLALALRFVGYHVVGKRLVFEFWSIVLLLGALTEREGKRTGMEDNDRMINSHRQCFD